MKKVVLLLILALVLVVQAATRLEDLPKSPNIDPLLSGFSKAQANETLYKVIETLKSVPEVSEFLRVLDQLQTLAKDPKIKEAALDPDVFRTLPEVVQDKGYNASEFELKLSDGFIVTVFRMNKGNSNGPPVLLSHGLLDSAFGWVINFPQHSLPYILADAGYDVWLGNVRGNVYGSKHVSYGRYDHKLWEHSFDQHGTYDVPELIDFILRTTGKPKLAVVGHSQGCAQLFSTAYQNRDLKDQVTLFVALAPAGYFDHLTNILVHLAAHFYLAELIELLGVLKFIELGAIEEALPYVCHAAPELVEWFLGLVMGYNPGEMDLTRLEVFCAHVGWTSVQNMVHWAQMVRSEKFRFHDYGYFGNKEHYGTAFPPEYEINRNWPSDVPVAVFYGGRDDLVTARDAEDLIKDLPSASIVLTKKIDDYAHLDFTAGIHAPNLIFNDIVRLLAQFLPLN